MSAREDILRAVRGALAEAPRDHVEVPRSYRDRHTPDGLVDLFAERVADYRATVVRCASGDVEASVVSALAGAGSVVVPADLGVSIPGAVADTGQSSAELDRIDAVVTTCAVGIAETGTIVLDHQAGQGRRALSLVPDRHVCIVRSDQIVAGVPEAVALLDAHRPLTWISGPSATSDIELNRVEGVHGPRNLVVIIAE
ncbi:MAG TPA: lactate utilization protein C [Dermatophilaceae bacterium]|nr:lactate utilization protein C [Dermatophilaceae bacterium]